LKKHISAEDFEKSQKYGKDKAKFALFSKLFNQCLDSAMLQYGFYAWCWNAAGQILGKFGYGAEYEVRDMLFHWCWVVLKTSFRSRNQSFSLS